MVDYGEKLGKEIPKGPGRALPLVDSTDDQRRKALQELNSPHYRLVHELFWFWPENDEDDALEALRNGQIAQSEKIWKISENGGKNKGVASHNLAVLYHCLALDYELTGQEVDIEPPLSISRDEMWSNAFSHWKSVLVNEPFWSLVTKRIRELDDPRLPTGSARRIREVLPQALLQPNAQLAITYAEDGALELARRQVRKMEDADLCGVALAQVLKEALEPLRERVKVSCKEALRRVDDEPLDGVSLADNLCEETKSALDAFKTLLAEDHATRIGAFDEVALAVLGCAIPYGNKTEDWPQALRVHELAIKLASSSSTEERIRANLAIVTGNEEQGRIWCQPGYFALEQPVVEKLEEARSLHKAGQREAALVILAGLYHQCEDEQTRFIILRPMAACLNRRALDRVDEMTSLANEPPSVLSPALSSRRFQLFSTFNTYYQTCESCSATLDDLYYSLTYEGLPIKLCTSCNSKLEAEQESRREKLRSLLQAAGSDLLFAQELDEGHTILSENLAFLQSMAENIEITLCKRKTQALELGFVDAREYFEELVSAEKTYREAALLGLDRWCEGWAERDEAKQLAPKLAKMLRQHETIETRIFAARVLRRLGSSSCVQVLSDLLPCLEEHDSSLRKAAADAIKAISQPIEKCSGVVSAAKRLGKRLGENWSYEDNLAAAQGLALLGTAGADYVPQLIELLIHSSSDLVREALGALEAVDAKWRQGEAAQRAIDRFVQRLLDDGEKGTYTIVLAIEKFGVHAKRAIPVLVSLLVSQQGDFSARARDALKAIDENWVKGTEARRAVPLLLAKLGDDNKKTRKAVKKILDHSFPKWWDLEEARAAIPYLIAGLAHQVNNVVSECKGALSKIEPKWQESEDAGEAIDKLIAIIVESSPGDIDRAQETLCKLSPHWTKRSQAKAAIPLLLKALDDEDEQKRLRARGLLEKLDKKALSRFDRWQKVDAWFITPLKIAAFLSFLYLAHLFYYHQDGDIPSTLSLYRSGLLSKDSVVDAMNEFVISSYNDIESKWAVEVILQIGRPSSRKAIGPLLRGSVNSARLRSHYLKVLKEIDVHWPCSREAKEAIPFIVEKASSAYDNQRKLALETLELISPKWYEESTVVRCVRRLGSDLSSYKKEKRAAAFAILKKLGPLAKDAFFSLDKFLRRHPEIASEIVPLMEIADEAKFRELVEKDLKNLAGKKRKWSNYAASQVVGQIVLVAYGAPGKKETFLQLLSRVCHSKYLMTATRPLLLVYLKKNLELTPVVSRMAVETQDHRQRQTLCFLLNGLGEKASVALPELTKYVRLKNKASVSSTKRQRAFSAIANLSPAALQKAASEENYASFFRLLDSGNSEEAIISIHVVENMGEFAKKALPKLRQLAKKSSKYSVRNRARRAIERISP